MSKVDSSATPETRALADAYAALNRNDIDGFVKCFEPEVVRIEPPGFPTAGTYRGIDAVRAHVAHGRGTWAEGTCEPVEFIVAGDKVVVVAKVHVRLKNATTWITGELADVFTFRNGKAIQYQSFGEVSDGLEFAGVRARDGKSK